jgi:hypothetical protein
MELSELFGLPAHPLLVHVPVVFLPLVTIGTLGMVLSPAFRDRFRWVIVAFAAVALVAVQLASGSGEELEHHVERGKLLHRHTELAESMLPLAIVLFVLVLACVLLERREMPPGRRWLITAVGLLTVVSALGTTARLIQVGHAGAKATWHKTDMDRRYRSGADANRE